MTREEREEWKTLDSRDSRQAFKERYWLRRDPTPGTEKNEFREMVLARIQAADKRFGIEKTPGSRTARGFLFVVFGSPARVRDERPDAPPAPPPPGTSPLRAPVGFVEGNETISTWIYDRERTPKILEGLGQPSLVITVVMEPNRRKDSIQNPGLVNQYRDVLARRSIVNPDLISPRSTLAERQAPIPLTPRHVLSPVARALLEQAPSEYRSGDGSVFGSAVLWRERGDPETLVWFFLPVSASKESFQSIIRSEKTGEEVATVSEPATPSPLFSTSGPGKVVMRRFALPAGSYSAAFAVLDETSGRPLAATSTVLRVPELQSRFAVSSLVLTRGPGTRDPAAEPLFSLDGAYVPPRADATFQTSESLWYFLEVVNPADPREVTLEPRIRRGGEPMGGLPPFAGGLEEVAPGRFVCGVEMPLASLRPGDYVLYVTVRDGKRKESEEVLRRADFQIVGAR